MNHIASTCARNIPISGRVCGCVFADARKTKSIVLWGIALIFSASAMGACATDFNSQEQPEDHVMNCGKKDEEEPAWCAYETRINGLTAEYKTATNNAARKEILDVYISEKRAR